MMLGNNCYSVTNEGHQILMETADLSMDNGVLCRL